MSNKEKNILLCITSLLISIILGIVWFFDGIFSDKKYMFLAIIFIIFFLYDTNGWCFKYKGLTGGTISLIHLFIGSFVLFHTNIFILIVLTLIFFYIRDKYLDYWNDKGE